MTGLALLPLAFGLGLIGACGVMLTVNALSGIIQPQITTRSASTAESAHVPPAT